MILHGAKVRVRGVCDAAYECAVIAGSWLRKHDQRDATGRFVISPRGRVYQVMYKPDGGLYNVHEGRVVPSLVGVP
jgi:hypothetical protein